MNPHAQSFEPPYITSHTPSHTYKYSTSELLEYQPYFFEKPLDFPPDLFIATYYNSAVPKHYKGKASQQYSSATPATSDAPPQSPAPSKKEKEQALSNVTTPILRRGGPPLPLRSELKKSKSKTTKPSAQRRGRPPKSPSGHPIEEKRDSPLGMFPRRLLIRLTCLLGSDLSFSEHRSTHVPASKWRSPETQSEHQKASKCRVPCYP